MSQTAIGDSECVSRALDKAQACMNTDQCQFIGSEMDPGHNSLRTHVPRTHDLLSFYHCTAQQEENRMSCYQIQSTNTPQYVVGGAATLKVDARPLENHGNHRATNYSKFKAISGPQRSLAHV